jgi:hypothetical protein
MGEMLRTRTRARVGSVLSIVVAGSLALAGPATAKPAGSGGGGPVTTEQPLAPPAAGAATIAGDIYPVLIAAVVIATAVLAFAVLRHMWARRAAST